jgi:hypothetical protein
LKNSLLENSAELKHSLLDMEKALLAQAIEWAREAFKRILEQVDLLIQQHRPVSLSIEHRRSIWYRTWLGPIRVNRRQYQDRDGKYRYLLDELMGMDKHHHTTIAVREIACRLAGEMPFRKSAEILNRTTPIDLSHQTIHRLVQTALADSQDNADRATAWFEETGELPQSEGREANRLMIEADGVVLPLQREQTRKAEVKLGIAYEGWQKVGNDRYSTVNKAFYADIAGADQFWAGMTLKLHQKYALSGTQYVVGGDGAAWIKEGADYFGGRYQLCRYHLNRALCHALGHDRKTLWSVQNQCSQGNFETALATLKEAAGRDQNDESKDIRRVMKYINSNASGLKDYREDLPQHDSALRRTGAIEGNIDKLIVRRMKNQGMSWSPQGIRRMLWLRINIREGTLANCLRAGRSNTEQVKLPEKQVNRVIDRTMKFDYASYFTAGLPAISGPHASRPWVELLKSLSRIAV